MLVETNLASCNIFYMQLSVKYSPYESLIIIMSAYYIAWVSSEFKVQMSQQVSGLLPGLAYSGAK